jgi:hypothetical protein
MHERVTLRSDELQNRSNYERLLRKVGFQIWSGAHSQPPSHCLATRSSLKLGRHLKRQVSLQAALLKKGQLLEDGWLDEFHSVCLGTCHRDYNVYRRVPFSPASILLRYRKITISLESNQTPRALLISCCENAATSVHCCSTGLVCSCSRSKSKTTSVGPTTYLRQTPAANKSQYQRARVLLSG